MDDDLAPVAKQLRDALCASPPLIDRGELASYSAVGRQLKLAARTIGYACSRLGDNYPTSEVPYHRIIRKNGMLPARFSGEGKEPAHRRVLRTEGHKVVRLRPGEDRWRVEGFRDCLRRTDRAPVSAKHTHV
jgi:alkylated DNA nucleotide flippase Atl1